MKKLGFTLVELLGIIVVLGAISLVTFNSIIRTVEKNKIRNNETLVNNMNLAAELYYNENMDKIIKPTPSSPIEVTGSTLVEEGYIDPDIKFYEVHGLDRYKVVISISNDGILSYDCESIG